MTSGQRFEAVAKNGGPPGWVWKVEVKELGTQFGDQLTGVLLVSGEQAAKELAVAINRGNLTEKIGLPV